MVRRLLLVIMAVALSFGLSGLAGYIIFINANGRTEVDLSMWVRFALNPLIVALVGALVGFLSKDHPIVTAIFGIIPWAILILGQIRCCRRAAGSAI